MRTIKFKGKSLYTKEWVVGDLFHEPHGVVCIVQHTDDTDRFVTVDPSTVCLFTGLKDSKGQEIWEGDILDGELKCEIVFTKGTFATHSIGDNGRVYSYPLCYFVKEDGTVDSKVIGNKFDKEK